MISTVSLSPITSHLEFKEQNIAIEQKQMDGVEAGGFKAETEGIPLQIEV